MIKSSINVSQVKQSIERLKERRIDVTLNLGRNKFISYVGVLTNVYPALFTVTPEDRNFKGKTSYSYSEYMCGKVKIKQLENEKTENLQ